MRAVLEEQGVDADAVFDEIATGNPIAAVQQAHEAAAKEHNVWGVPTFILGDRAVFVRLMDRRHGDGATPQRVDREGARPARRLARAQRVQAHLDPPLT